MAPGDVDELVGFAITTAEQKHQGFVRQLFDRTLARVQFDRIGQAAVLDDGVGRNREVAGRRDEPPHGIAEWIEIGCCRNRRNRRRRDFVAQLLRPLTMRVEEADHHGRLRAIKHQFIAVSNEHKLIPTSMRESALTGFHKAGFGSEPDRRKRRHDWIMLVYTHPQITTDRCEARDQKHEQKRDATGSIKCPSQFSATKIAPTRRMAGSTARFGCVHRLASPQSRTRCYFIQYLSLLLRCPSTPCRW